ncbi:MAG TPA: flagellar brake protein [Usitatibacteraceae bacterium]
MTERHRPTEDAGQIPPVSTLPELAIADLEPYQVYSRVEILANVHALIDQQILATVYFDRGEKFFATRFLAVNPEFEELIFALGADSRVNEQLKAVEGLTVVAFLDHIKVQFAVDRAEPTQFEDAPAFRMRMPRSILRLQRRNAFRARTPLVKSPMVLLPPVPDREGKSDTTRVRITDISATGLAFVTQVGRPILSAGMRLLGCQLELGENKKIDADMEVRHVSIYKDGVGSEMCRAGCMLLRLSGPAQTTIQRYVNQLAASEYKIA